MHLLFSTFHLQFNRKFPFNTLPCNLYFRFLNLLGSFRFTIVIMCCLLDANQLPVLNLP